jgi:hypothetical protein
MKKILKNISFGAWMYFNLRHLRSFHYNIKEFRDSGNLEKEREQILISTSTWGRGLMKKYKINLNVMGIENIPDGPVLFVSNHQGYADIPVYCAAITEKQIGFVAKSSLKKIPVIHNQSTDPGPPSAIAVPTPTIFPVPRVAAKEVVNAPNWEISPDPSLSLYTESLIPNPIFL